VEPAVEPSEEHLSKRSMWMAVSIPHCPPDVRVDVTEDVTVDVIVDVAVDVPCCGALLRSELVVAEETVGKMDWK